MLTVTFYRDERDRLSGFFARGHAGFAEHSQDIVCAAVSAILLAARLGLEQHAGVELDASQEPGELRIRWSEGARNLASVQAIVSTAELAVARIAADNPKHVRVRHQRVTP